MNLTTKEKFLLEDQKTHEQACILKYSNYANLASDQQLKNIFKQNGQAEQEHLNTINQLLSGQIPSMTQQSGGNKQPQQQSQQTSQVQKSQQASQMQQMSNSSQQQNSSNTKWTDKDLCTDILMTEKFVSGAYNTAVFEFRDTQIRDALNHIQKEEQQHGESVFKYMEDNGMYSAK